MCRPPMHRVALLLLAAAVALPAAADTVRLKNGRAYEGVLAERTPAGVRVQLAFGHIVIPDDQVLAVDKGPSVLATYLARRAALEARPDAPAADWLELARWAKVHDLSTSSRQAAMLAAELDPRLPGLDAMLRPLGLVFEEALVRWIPLEESMARRGLVRWEGQWVSVEEKREGLAAAERRRAADQQEAATRRMAAAAEAMQRTQERILVREAMRQEAESRAPLYMPVITYPGFWIPPVVVVVAPTQPGHQPRPHFPRDSFSTLGSRQPGTFLQPEPPLQFPQPEPMPANKSSATSSTAASGSGS